MSRITMRSLCCLLPVVLLVCLSGCGRSGSEAGKLLAKGKHYGAQAGKQALKGGKKILKDEVPEWLRDQAVDALRDMNDPQVQARRRQQQQEQLRAGLASGSPQRFPHPVTSVQPVQGGERIDRPDLGLFGIENNFGGHNIYRRDGSPVGFTAFHQPSGEVHHFDALGFRIK